MQKDDRIRLRHMLDAALEATKSVEGRTRSDLDRNRVWTLGLMKCVEIIGEAAGRVGPGTRGEYPQVPWSRIVAMRNRLVHAYFDVDLDQVWKAVTEDLPPLADMLQEILGPESGS